MAQFAVHSGTEQPLCEARGRRLLSSGQGLSQRTGATKASNQSFLGIMMVLTLLFAALVGECSAAAPQPLIVGDTRVTALSERCAPEGSRFARWHCCTLRLLGGQLSPLAGQLSSAPCCVCTASPPPADAAAAAG